ncbi:GMC oxidoreductase [Paraburkholderia sp. SIMBA_030]|uniref:GMC oxidoreductase n=1 Tax=Paraburkholderia sp. SIMBA_030 TaxID=3085773 RepID=UPI00397BF3BA
MTHTRQGVNPLHQRMIDDMHMRRLSPRTQANYLRIVREFSRFLGRSPSMSVVDASLRVHGIQSLRIADSSIMPTLTSGNTAAICMVIGEKASRMILDRQKERQAA